jgi:hypothetical protein
MTTFQQTTVEYRESAEHKTMVECLVGFCCGLGSLALFWLPFIGLASGIVGLIYSLRGKRRVRDVFGKMAVAGEVTSIIGICWCGLWTIVPLLSLARMYGQ